MKTNNNLFPGIFLLAILISGCKSQVPPAHLEGTYEDMLQVTVRTKENGDWVFTRAPDSVAMHLEITADGSVKGFVGNAVFENASCENNRGDLGRALNIKTDYIIRGTLKGAVFSEDPIAEKEISLPFNIDSGSMHGTLFQLGPKGVYPMAGPGD